MTPGIGMFAQVGHPGTFPSLKPRLKFRKKLGLPSLHSPKKRKAERTRSLADRFRDGKSAKFFRHGKTI